MWYANYRAPGCARVCKGELGEKVDVDVDGVVDE